MANDVPPTAEQLPEQLTPEQEEALASMTRQLQHQVDTIWQGIRLNQQNIEKVQQGCKGIQQSQQLLEVRIGRLEERCLGIEQRLDQIRLNIDDCWDDILGNDLQANNLTDEIDNMDRAASRGERAP